MIPVLKSAIVYSMADSILNDYIDEQLTAGAEVDEITQALLDKDWDEEHVSQAFATLNDTASPEPESKLKGLGKMAAVYGLIFVVGSGIGVYFSAQSQTGTGASLADSNQDQLALAETPPPSPTGEPAEVTQVLGAETESSPSSAPLETPEPEITAAETDESTEASPSAHAVSQSSYTIALVGDSMFETLNSHLDSLVDELQLRYEAEFQVYNYSNGAENVSMALERLEESFVNNSKNYPSIFDISPDIVVIGSFAYNPFDPHDINRHWLDLATLVSEIKNTGADVYLLADIAPLRDTFALGSKDWSTTYRQQHAQKVVDQLDSTIGLAQALEVPLINVFESSKAIGNYGNGTYTDSGDGIHPNEAGKLLMIEYLLEGLVID